jgi:hypothetical protein
MYFSSNKNSSSTKGKHAQQVFGCPKTCECSQYNDGTGAAYHLGLKREVPEAMVCGLAL